MSDASADDRSALEENRLTAARLGKVEALRAAGVEPYPYRFNRTALAAELHERHTDLGPEASTGEQVVVAGRLMAMREIGSLAFGVVADPSGRIQLFADEGGLAESFAAFTDLDVASGWTPSPCWPRDCVRSQRSGMGSKMSSNATGSDTSTWS